jgi:hypothetical protein
MKPADACTRCGSSKVIPRARVIERAADQALRVAVARKPAALVFKGEEKIDAYARVCGECGFVELFAEDPHALYEAYLIARSTTDA